MIVVDNDRDEDRDADRAQGGQRNSGRGGALFHSLPVPSLFSRTLRPLPTV